MATAVDSKQDIRFEQLSWVDVQLLFDMLFQIIWLSGLYDKPTKVSRMLYDALSGKCVVWLIFSKDEEAVVPFGVLVTQMYYMPYTGKRVCSIVHGNSVSNETIPDEEWRKAYKKIMRYAKDNGCARFEVFSENDRVRDILTAFGFKPSGLYIKEL